jgi:hypothetical protein
MENQKAVNVFEFKRNVLSNRTKTVRGNRNRVFQGIKRSVAVLFHGKIYQKILKLHQGFT